MKDEANTTEQPQNTPDNGEEVNDDTSSEYCEGDETPEKQKRGPAKDLMKPQKSGIEKQKGQNNPGPVSSTKKTAFIPGGNKGVS